MGGACCKSRDNKVINPEPVSTVDSKVLFRNARVGDINEDYKMGEIFHTSDYGICRVAQSKLKQSLQVMIKIIDKQKIQSGLILLKREVEVLGQLTHPNIIKLHEIYEDAKYLYTVFELCNGGSLLERLESKTYDENEAREIAKQILRGVNHLHQSQICHRNLQPQTFMFLDSTPQSQLKIINFGFSTKFSGNQNDSGFMSKNKIDIIYLSPEGIRGQYSTKSDIWSVGIILYLILSGNYPFSCANRQQLCEQIVHAQINVTNGIWQQISQQAKDLVVKLLQKDPNRRITAAQALKHQWFKSKNLTTRLSLQHDLIEQINDYKTLNLLEKETMAVIARQLTVNQMEQITRMFSEYDQDQSGYLTLNEVQQLFHQFGMSQENITQLFHNLDLKKDGKIDYNEFSAALVYSKGFLDEENLWMGFKKFDIDNSGFITIDNIKQAFERAGKIINQQRLQQIIQEADTSQDGKISFDEFKSMLAKSDLDRN